MEKLLVGNLIIEINNNKINKNGMIWSDTMSMFVPPNTYMMINANLNKGKSIDIKCIIQKNKKSTHASLRV